MGWHEQLQEMVARREQAQGHAEDAQDGLYAAMLAAYEAGASYRQIAAATGLSRIRVGQVLKLQRQRTEVKSA